MKKFIALLLIVPTIVFAQDAGSTDGGTRLADIYAVCPEAPLMERTPDGGYFMTQARHDRIACMMTGCGTYARRLESNAREQAAKKDESSTLSVQLIITSAVLIFAGGVALGVGVGERLKK